MKRQNFYIQIDGNNNITNVSLTYKVGYIPVAVDLSHLTMFNNGHKGIKYSNKDKALVYPTPVNSLDEIFGVEFSGSSTNPKLTRTNSSVGLTAGINGAKNDFDKVGPWSAMKKVTDSKGNQFIQIPPIYVKRVVDNNTGKGTLQISCKQFPGSYLPLCFINQTTNKVGPVDVGCFLNAPTNTTNPMVSKPNLSLNWQNNNGLTLSQNRSTAYANGPQYCDMDIYVWKLLKDLVIVEFADLSFFQQVNNTNSNEIPSTNQPITKDASTTSTSNLFNYRGLESLYGYYAHWIDGISVNPSNKTISIGNDYTKYNDNGQGYSQVATYSTGFGAPTSYAFDSKYPDIQIPIQTGNSGQSWLYAYLAAFGPVVGSGGYTAGFGGFASVAVGGGGSRLIYHP